MGVKVGEGVKCVGLTMNLYGRATLSLFEGWQGNEEHHVQEADTACAAGVLSGSSPQWIDHELLWQGLAELVVEPTPRQHASSHHHRLTHPLNPLPTPSAVIIFFFCCLFMNMKLSQLPTLGLESASLRPAEIRCVTSPLPPLPAFRPLAQSSSSSTPAGS